MRCPIPRVIELKDGKVETLLSERDFAYLIEKHIGYEAADVFRGLMEELEEYREEDKDGDE